SSDLLNPLRFTRVALVLSTGLEPRLMRRGVVGLISWAALKFCNKVMSESFWISRPLLSCACNCKLIKLIAANKINPFLFNISYILLFAVIYRDNFYILILIRKDIRRFFLRFVPYEWAVLRLHLLQKLLLVSPNLLL